ncbi:MAG: DASS family sodium-coupled anion symporter [Betaproteobacteria bacterium]|nr:DASS family sodium-coupled anion symporter [Betaproteobacteria bacterium]MDH5343113.1 DASS family sodium-coupled anion symporter [Betaproteobacteria bacterium]
MASNNANGRDETDHTHPAAGEGTGHTRAQPVPVRRVIALFAGPVLMLVLLALPSPQGLSPEAWRLAAFAAWMVVWWIGEAVPIPATALLPIPMMPLLGIGQIGAVTANYGHPLIFLFLGGFLLAAAMQRWGLHKRIALKIIRIVGTSAGGIIAGFMLATAFLSMWISNTAATIMMFAVGLSVIEFIARKTPDRAMVRNFGVALMLSIAYSASIGGVGTLIGSPPNALLASYLQRSHGIPIDFFTWMQIGMPVVLVMLPVTWLMLTRVIFSVRELKIGDAADVIRSEFAALGPMSRGEGVVAAVFVLAALGWILRQPLADLSGLAITDTTIALLAALLLFAWPVSREKAQFALDWESARNIPWGVLLLFGGGLALADGFNGTGLAMWIGTQVSGFEVSTWVLILIVTAAIIYLTEITSNTASTATFLPILGAVAVGLGIDPRIIVVPVALGASMAFMMPVATPPNAIVFSYSGLKLGDMVKAGFWLNIIAIGVIVGEMILLAPLVFGL